MSRKWNENLASTFWAKRCWHVVGRDDQITEREQARLLQLEQSKNKDLEQRTQFVNRNQDRFSSSQRRRTSNVQTTISDLSFWMKFCSWTYCPKCFSIIEEKLLPKFTKRPPLKPSKVCSCSKNRYVIPLPSLIPDQLLDLSFQDICVLRPLDFHVGDYVRQKHGYIQKHGKSHVTWSKVSVEQKILNIADQRTRARCQQAYNFLMGFDGSSYSIYVNKREQYFAANREINLYDLNESVGIECALWPNLYPFTTWCDTVHEGKQGRLSQKVSFFSKAKSSIVDYIINYELLQFNYDLWLFKTVSGAIASARHMKCSPARALNAKVFSAGYWKMQHRLLIDAVRQFGYPDLFLTISPYEWTFPFPQFFDSARELTGKGPIGLAGLETIHITHVLEQIVRGYLCGSNTKKWTSNVFSHNKSKTRKNVQTYFYRFEFQKRGTVHLHLLVWLKNIKIIDHHLIRADIPWENPDTAYLVNKLQPSDKRSLKLNNKPTAFSNVRERTVLNLFYPQEAFALNLRAYIETLVPSLNCRMDVQVTDGRHMVLRYVTSYVSKWQDAYANESLYSTHVLPYQAAHRHVTQLQPCEPEMWLYMSSFKFAWSCSRTKDYTAPKSSSVSQNAIHQKYASRPNNMDNLSFLQWLRHVDHKKTSAKLYKNGNTLVSVQMLSPFNDEYYFQHLLMNHPHRSIEQLKHPQYDTIPEQIRHFASAVFVMPHIWTDDEVIREQVTRQGNKNHYVDTVMSHIVSKRDTLHLWQMGILRNQHLITQDQTNRLSFPLDDIQSSICERVIQSLLLRNTFYETPFDDHESSLDVEVIDEPVDPALPEPLHNPSLDWKKLTLVTGEAGTGKSHLVCAVVKQALDHNWKVLVVCPTGILARQYRNKFSSNNLVCDTVHSSFHIPVNTSEKPSINWNLVEFDLVVLDELSMVSKRIADHVIATLSELTIRPVVMVTGDQKQIQPIETIDKKIQQVKNILDEKDFFKLVYHFSLKRQYRTLDQQYENFLRHIRDWRPSQQLLDNLQNGRVICDDLCPSDDDIVQLMTMHPDATILTFTRQATARINAIFIHTLFSDATPLATVQCDYEMQPIPIYCGMRVIITQNRDKNNNVVNGQLATVHCIRNKTVFLKLPNDQIAATYPVTYLDKEGLKCICYPFAPCYALTVAKAIGLTLGKVILWLDILNIPPGFAYVALSREYANYRTSFC